MAKEKEAAPEKQKRKTRLIDILPIIIIIACFVVAFQKNYISLPDITESIGQLPFLNKGLEFLQPQIKITSISASSAMPAELITIYGTGFDRTTPLLVGFSDDSGYNIVTAPGQVTDTGVIVAVPPYVDFENYSFGSGTVNVHLLSESGESNAVQLNIKDLPKYTTPPGTVTVQFLTDLIQQIKDTKRHILIVQNLTNETVPTDTIATLDRLAAGYAALKKEVESVMKNSSKKAVFAQMGGQTFYYNRDSLAISDRLYGSMMEAPISQKNQITGAAVGVSSTCRRLEGLELGVIIACIQKYYSFGDAVTEAAEYANEQYVKNAVVEKAFKLNSFLSDVGFFAFTLPGMYDSYNQDVNYLTETKGYDESEVAAAVRDYYLEKLALKALDTIPKFGTAMGIMGDLIVGPSDVLFHNSFKGVMLTEGTTAGYAKQVNLGPEDNGLNLITCTDLCTEKKKDMAVMAGVKGNGRIASAPRGISCPGDCTEIYKSDVSTVKLYATPDKGYVFEGWSLACSGQGTCMLSFGKDKAVIATFTKEPEQVVVPDNNNPPNNNCPATSKDMGKPCCAATAGGNLQPAVSAVYVYAYCDCPSDTEFLQMAPEGDYKLYKICQCKCK